MSCKIEKCPFCKASCDLIDVLHYYSEVYQVECSNCGARGEYSAISTEPGEDTIAIENWNRISRIVQKDVETE